MTSKVVRRKTMSVNIISQSYLIDPNVSPLAPLQQPDRLFSARVTISIRAFCFWMKLIFGHDVAVGFDARSFAIRLSVCGDAVRFAGILVDPFHFQPLPGICFVRSN
jgi:hypothetical protein